MMSDTVNKWQLQYAQKVGHHSVKTEEMIAGLQVVNDARGFSLRFLFLMQQKVGDYSGNLTG